MRNTALDRIALAGWGLFSLVESERKIRDGGYCLRRNAPSLVVLWSRIENITDLFGRLDIEVNINANINANQIIHR